MGSAPPKRLRVECAGDMYTMVSIQISPLKRQRVRGWRWINGSTRPLEGRFCCYGAGEHRINSSSDRSTRALELRHTAGEDGNSTTGLPKSSPQVERKEEIIPTKLGRATPGHYQASQKGTAANIFSHTSTKGLHRDGKVAITQTGKWQRAPEKGGSDAEAVKVGRD